MNQPPAKTPTCIYVVGIGMLLLGLLSFCCSGWGIVGSAQDQSEAMRGNPFMDQGMLEAIIQAQETTRVPVLIVSVVSILVALTILVFAGFVLARKPLALLTPIVLFVAIGWTIVHTGVTLWTQTVQMDAMKPALEQGGIDAEAMQGAMGFGMGFAVCLYGGWALLKLGFYLFGAIYLRKEDVRAHLSGGPVYDDPPGGGYGGPPHRGPGYGGPPPTGPGAGGYGGPGGTGGYGGPGGTGGPPPSGPGYGS